MTIAKQMLEELKEEAQTTRKILALVPHDKSDWKPHDKSMTMGNLSSHIAEIYGWTDLMVNANELDFATMDYKPPVIESNAGLIELFEKGLKNAEEVLATASDEQMAQPWTMRQGETIFFTLPKSVVLRTWVHNHIIHHRAQLGVYLRLQNIALPGSYGPTADEM